jgi:nitroreductase
MNHPDVVKLLEERRSVRTFRPEQITEEELQAIVRIITDVPTHHNTQLVHFTVVQDKALLDELAEKIRQIMLQGNPGMVKKASTPGYSPLHHAPTVIFISGQLKTDFHVQTECGVAAGQIISAATAMGLASCITASSLFMFRGEDGEDIKRRLGIPEDYQAVATVALGYLDGDMPARPEKTEKVNYVR